MHRGDPRGPLKRRDDPRDHGLSRDLDQRLAGNARVIAQIVLRVALTGEDDGGEIGRLGLGLGHGGPQSGF
jgi:hypothetical protein